MNNEFQNVLSVCILMKLNFSFKQRSNSKLMKKKFLDMITWFNLFLPVFLLCPGCGFCWKESISFLTVICLYCREFVWINIIFWGHMIASTYLMLLLSFYTPWKYGKTRGFPMFSGGYWKRPVVWKYLNILHLIDVASACVSAAQNWWP